LTFRRSIARLVPQPGQNTSSHGISAISAAPFDPIQAIAKSAQLLHDLRVEFGNLGLAAAAYNAGPGRVRDGLGGRRPLPGETQAYVRLVTGHSAEEWVNRTLSYEVSSGTWVP
jgi:soluble lytic murein transglycosylase-like protein